MAPICCVPTCKRQHLKVHRMPVSRAKTTIWIDVIARAVPSARSFLSLPWAKLSKLFICHNHFETQYVRQSMRLHSNACPSLFTLDEIESGKPTKTYAEFCDKFNHDHSYYRMPHEDHTYYYKPMEEGYNLAGFIYKADKENKAPVLDPCEDEDKPEKKLTFPIGEYEPKLGIFTRGIPDSYADFADDLPESAFQSLEEPEPLKKEESIFSWDKGVVEVMTEDDGDSVVYGGREEPAELPPDISLYCDDETDPNKEDEGDGEDKGYQCNECNEAIAGFRYTCVQCADFDLCPLCEARAAHGEHYVLRVPAARAYSEIQSVLTAIRQQILSEKLFLTAVGDSLKTEIKLESDEVPDAVIDLNDASPNTNEATPGANNPFPIDLYNHFPELDDPMPDFVTVPTIDPLDESVSDIENSRAESNDSRDDNPSVQNNSVESNITALRCSDTENSPQRKRHCPKPFSKTYGDSINLSHLRILKNPSDESTERPQVTFNPFVNIRSLKPISWDCEPEKEREDQRTIGVVDKANRKRVLAHARKRRTLRRKTHRKAEDLSADEADEISPRLQDTRLPESPRLSPHILKRKSRKTKSSPVENRVLRSTERKKEQRVEERVESESEDKRNSEEISKPEFTLQLPADTNVEALIQALQCQVSVRLKRDF